MKAIYTLYSLPPSGLKRKVCVLPNNDGLKSEDLQCQEKMQPVKKRKTGSFGEWLLHYVGYTVAISHTHTCCFNRSLIIIGKEEIKGDTEAYRNEIDNEDDVKGITKVNKSDLMHEKAISDSLELALSSLLPSSSSSI